MLFRSGQGTNAIVSTAAGSANQVLTANSGAAPSFQDIVSGGRGLDSTGTDETHVIRLNKNTISSSLTVDNGDNGLTAGPVTVGASATITVNGAWHIIG